MFDCKNFKESRLLYFFISFI